MTYGGGVHPIIPGTGQAPVDVPAPEQVHSMFNYFFESGQEGAGRLESLRVSPRKAIREAAEALKMSFSPAAVTFMAVLLSESRRAASIQGEARRQRAEERIERSIKSLRRAYRMIADLGVKKAVIQETERCVTRTVELIHQYCEQLKQPRTPPGPPAPTG